MTDAAAFAEARAEYWADVALTMRARDDDSDLVDLRCAKNRVGRKTPMVLKLDRTRARFEAVAATWHPGAMRPSRGRWTKRPRQSCGNSGTIRA